MIERVAKATMMVPQVAKAITKIPHVTKSKSTECNSMAMIP
jgi:hypothetical protein